MLNKNLLDKMLTLMLAISISVMGGFELFAQTEGNFTNNSNGKYIAGNTANSKGGIIRMKGTAANHGEFDGANPLGATSGTRIQGTVIWNKNADQNVQPRYYTNLGVEVPLAAKAGNLQRFFGMSGSWATDPCTPDNGTNGPNRSYFVSGSFTRYGNTLRATPLTDAQAIKFRNPGSTDIASSTTVPAGVTFLPVIVHDCFSDFWYDGTTNQVALGTIKSGTGVTNDNYYSFLNQHNPAALYLGSETYTQVFNQEATCPEGHTIVNGALNISTGTPLRIELLTNCVTEYAGKTCIDDTTTIDTLEIVDCNDPNWATLRPDIECPTPCNTPGCDTADPCDVNNPTALYAGADVVIEITGGIEWDGKTPDKVLPFCFYAGYACDESGNPIQGQEPTRVIYSGNGLVGIYPAHYGILEFASNVPSEISLLGNVYIKGKRPYALDHQNTKNIITGDKHIVFEDVCAQPTYTACGEVEGWIYRTASTPSKEYRYHNQLTTLALNEVPKDASNKEWFGLLSLPDVEVGVDPLSKAKVAPAGTGYVNRVWQVDFATANSNASIEKMNLANKITEIDPDLIPNFAAIRGYEAWNTNELPLPLVGNGSNPWLLNGAAPSTVPTTGTCGFFVMNQTENVDIVLGSDPAVGNADDLFPGSQIVFGNVPTIIQSVRNGRWSNPATWGGITPTSGDSVLVRHLVYTGIYDQQPKLGQAAWSTNEHDLPGVYDATTQTTLLAKSVNILSTGDIATLITENRISNVNTDNAAALIIGNHDIAGFDLVSQTVNDKQGTAMNFDVVLTFGTIENRNNAGNHNASPNWGYADLNNDNLPSVFGGLYLMGNISNGLVGGSLNTARTEPTLTNTYIFLNDGNTINDAIFEVGKQ